MEVTFPERLQDNRRENRREILAFRRILSPSNLLLLYAGRWMMISTESTRLLFSTSRSSLYLGKWLRPFDKITLLMNEDPGEQGLTNFQSRLGEQTFLLKVSW